MIAIGCDHGGYALKKEIIEYLQQEGVEFKDMGTNSTEAVDYPDYARAVSESVLSGEADKGILICGTGIGISLVLV